MSINPGLFWLDDLIANPKFQRCLVNMRHTKERIAMDVLKPPPQKVIWSEVDDPESYDPRPLRHVPVLVGIPVQYFTPNTEKHSRRGGFGPYAAIIVEITDAEKGMVCLRVFPAFMPSYDVANVGYADVEKPPLLDEPFEAFWRMPSFYD